MFGDVPVLTAPGVPGPAGPAGEVPVGNYLHRVIHNGTSYPARPAGIAAGLVEYVGPTTPTTWIDGDTWIKTS